MRQALFLISVGLRLFCLVYFAVTAHKLINTSGCIYQLVLTCIERVRTTGDFKFNQRIGFTFKLYGVVCFASRARKKHIAVAHIFEYHRTVIFWMNAFFHCCILILFYYSPKKRCKFTAFILTGKVLLAVFANQCLFCVFSTVGFAFETIKMRVWNAPHAHW